MKVVDFLQGYCLRSDWAEHVALNPESRTRIVDWHGCMFERTGSTVTVSGYRINFTLSLSKFDSEWVIHDGWNDTIPLSPSIREQHARWMVLNGRFSKEDILRDTGIQV